MYQPTSAAPTSRLLAVGDFLLIALRLSPKTTDLTPRLEASLDQLSNAASCSATALRKVTPHRVALQFAEQRLAVIVQPLVADAGKLGLVPSPELSGKSRRVASAEDLLARAQRHPSAGPLCTKHAAPVGKAIDDVKAQVRACELAFEAHERVFEREIEARESFIATYNRIATDIAARIPEALRGAFFDDPTSRRAGARVEAETVAPAVPTLRIAA